MPDTIVKTTFLIVHKLATLYAILTLPDGMTARRKARQVNQRPAAGVPTVRVISRDTGILVSSSPPETEPQTLTRLPPAPPPYFD